MNKGKSLFLIINIIIYFLLTPMLINSIFYLFNKQVEVHYLLNQQLHSLNIIPYIFNVFNSYIILLNYIFLLFLYYKAWNKSKNKINNVLLIQSFLWIIFITFSLFDTYNIKI